MNIFFDLDGTLIDSRERLYVLFQHLVPQSKFTFDDYWLLKRNKNTHAIILRDKFEYDEDQISAFEREWLKMIELPEWLKYDVPFDGVTSYLEALKQNNHRLFVVTARQSEMAAHKQIEALGWAHLFDRLFVTSQKIDKFDLIKNSGLDFCAADWFVGDTGKDVETGKKLGLKTAAVLSGFLSEEVLLSYNPDIIIADVLRFPSGDNT